MVTVSPHTQASQANVLKSLNIEGLDRTQSHVIERELGFKVGEPVSKDQIELGISNLRNTNLFSTVNYQTTENIDGIDLTVILEERWTTIPILKIASGGDVTQTTIGLYDPNVLGRYLEIGAQAEKIEDVTSGVLWFKNPRLFDKNLGIDVQFWDTSRIRTKYDQNADDLEITNGFLRSNERLHLGLTNQFTPNLSGSLFIENSKDSFSDRFVSDEVKSILAIEGLPPDTEYNFVGIGFTKGRINHKGYLLDGMEWGAQIRRAYSSKGETEDFWQSDLLLRYYKTFLDKGTIAQRVMAGSTSTDIIQYWYYLGGLDRIRGYSDNRFAGRHFLLSNSEVRYPVVTDSNYVIQATSFIDLLSIGEQAEDLDSIQGASVGLGLRIILPKFYRMAIRFDFASRLKKDDDQNFSFGVQQFF